MVGCATPDGSVAAVSAFVTPHARWPSGRQLPQKRLSLLLTPHSWHASGSRTGGRITHHGRVANTTGPSHWGLRPTLCAHRKLSSSCPVPPSSRPVAATAAGPATTTRPPRRSPSRSVPSWPAPSMRPAARTTSRSAVTPGTSATRQRAPTQVPVSREPYVLVREHLHRDADRYRRIRRDRQTTRQVTVTGAPGNQNPVAEFTPLCSALDCTFTDASTDATARSRAAAGISATAARRAPSKPLAYLQRDVGHHLPCGADRHGRSGRDEHQDPGYQCRPGGRPHL